MPKVKTRKSVIKRFKITGTKKVMRRPSGQNHFNSKESGKHTRQKRKAKMVAGRPAKNILKDIQPGL